MVNSNSTSTAIQRYVVRIDRSESGVPLTVYILRYGITKAERLAVLAEVRTLFPGINVSAIGNEVAVFARDDRGM